MAGRPAEGAGEREKFGMTAILAFPLSRRVGLIRSQADYLCSLGHRAAESRLFGQLQRQRDVLLAKGIDPLEVEKEVQELAGAIRAEIWHRVLGQPLASR